MKSTNFDEGIEKIKTDYESLRKKYQEEAE